MTSPTINSDSPPRRRFQLTAGVAALALASLVAVAPAWASDKVDGISADLKNGTL